MRISQLSQASGVSAASIKYYAREGLMPAGSRTGYNTTEYEQAHVERLRLVRALIDTGGLSIAAARRVIAAIDDPEMPMPRVLGVAQQALPREGDPPSASAMTAIRAIMRERGWVTVVDNPGIAMAAEVLDQLASIGHDMPQEWQTGYAEAMDLVASADLDVVEAADGDRDRMAQIVVVGTALGDALLAGLRRIAQEAHTHRRYHDGVVPTDAQEPA